MTSAPAYPLGPAEQTTFLDAVHFEWIKMRTVQASLWPLLATTGLMVAIALIGVHQIPPGAGAATVVSDMMGGVLFGQVAMCAFGAMAVTGEYATGTIAASFIAVPHRPRLLGAKALVVWVLATVAGMIAGVAAFVAGTAALPTGIAHPGINAGSAVRTILGLGAYLGVLAVLALAIGLLARSSVAAVTTTTIITVAIPITLLSTGSFGRSLDTWWPTEAGRQNLAIGAIHRRPAPPPRAGPRSRPSGAIRGGLPPRAGLAYLTGVTLATSAVATWLVTRRDA